MFETVSISLSLSLLIVNFVDVLFMQSLVIFIGIVNALRLDLIVMVVTV